MKMWIRKSVMQGCAMVMLLGMLAGCSGGTSPEVEKSSEESSQKEVESSPKYTVSWVSGQSAPVEEDAEMVAYWEEQLDVDLDVWNIESTNYSEVLNLRFASEEIPDRMVVHGFGNLKKYADQDIIAEIPLEMLKEHAPNVYAKTVEAFPDTFNYTKMDGKLYGIPTINYYNNFRSPIVWRGDWLRNVGIEKTPETLEEFETALYKLRNDDPDGNGKKDTYGLSASALNLVYGAFGYLPDRWAEKDGKLVHGAIQPEMKEALKLLNQWHKDGVIDPEFVTGENKGGYWALSHAFINGQIGLSSLGVYYHWKPLLFEGDGASHNYLELQKLNPEAADALVHGTPPLGRDGAMGVAQGNLMSGKVIAFGKHLEKQPEKLAKILAMIETISATLYENYLTAMYGKEGKHWEFDDNNVPILLNNMSSQDLERMGANNVMESLELPEYTAKRTAIVSEWAEKEQYNIGGMTNKLQAPLASEGRYLTELKKIIEEAYISFITGDRSLDEFDAFVKLWRSSGGEQLEKEANEWWASVQ
ncbi:extracellular solute-binding protein [Paenibacillus chungangensis]|uniref:Extracellular solute-binding protein n=1 Tax=Paenibacillus chungangensis TaxID=696535 RepID=A0ABW3HRP9_9BACL